MNLLRGGIPTGTSGGGLSGEKWGLQVLLEGGSAKYDWLSCATRVSATETDWDRLKGADLDVRHQQLSEQITHEVVHFLQTLASSYLYRFSLRLWWAAAPALRAVLAETPPPAKAVHEMGALYRSLDDPGRYGFTARHIIEAGAFHAQKTFNWIGNIQARYQEDLYPETAIYQPVFDHLLRLLGDELRGVASIPLLTTLALRHDHPGDAFVQIASNWVEEVRTGSRFISWERLLANTDVEYLGDLTDVEQAEGRWHPLLREPAAMFSQLVDLYVFAERPDKAMTEKAASDLLPAIILNNRVIGGRWSGDVRMLVAVAEASRRLLRLAGLA